MHTRSTCRLPATGGSPIARTRSRFAAAPTTCAVVRTPHTLAVYGYMHAVEYVDALMVGMWDGNAHTAVACVVHVACPPECPPDRLVRQVGYPERVRHRGSPAQRNQKGLLVPSLHLPPRGSHMVWTWCVCARCDMYANHACGMEHRVCGRPHTLC